MNELSKHNVLTKGIFVNKPYPKGNNQRSTLLGQPTFLTKELNNKAFSILNTEFLVACYVTL